MLPKVVVLWTAVISLTIITGFNPVWNESLSHVLHFPELALVRFRVMDSDTLSDDFIGQYTLPFDSIAAGKYQHRIEM